MAIARTAPDPSLAQGFLRFLCETQGATAGWRAGRGRRWAAPRRVSSLVADLLGATLVDAQDELWTAWRALEGLADREQALAWLIEPPPWPPASVAKYLGGEGERAMALIETLAAEVAPEPPARAWLMRSWLSPARLVDQAFLAELGQAAKDGSAASRGFAPGCAKNGQPGPVSAIAGSRAGPARTRAGQAMKGPSTLP